MGGHQKTRVRGESLSSMRTCDCECEANRGSVADGTIEKVRDDYVQSKVLGFYCKIDASKEPVQGRFEDNGFEL